MKHLRALCFVLPALIAAAPLAMANPAPPPSVRDKTTDSTPTQIDPVTGQPMPVREEPRRRTGPFRSCGSGAGLGLAGIGVAWGLMWIGTRYAGRIVRGRNRDQKG